MGTETMKLNWHNFAADPKKYEQPADRKILWGAKGPMYTYGVEQARGQKDYTLIITIGPLVMRQILQPSEAEAKLTAQRHADGKSIR